MKKLLTLILLLSFTIKAQEIKIGAQTWTTKNLDVSKFRNGEAIPLAKTNAEWALAGQNQQPAWCYYENKGENGIKYGKLYNWYAVNDPRGLAPSGYHIPTDAEWTILTDYLGGDSIAGAKMKSTSGWKSFDGTTPCKVCKDWTDGYREGKDACKACANWTEDYRGGNTCKLCNDKKIINGAKHICSSCKNNGEPDSLGTFIYRKTIPAKIPGNGTNTSGFTLLPGGLREPKGPFGGIVWVCSFWSTSQDEARAYDEAAAAAEYAAAEAPIELPPTLYPAASAYAVVETPAVAETPAVEAATTPKRATEIATKPAAETSPPVTFIFAWCRVFAHESGKAGRLSLDKPAGMFIRCVKD